MNDDNKVMEIVRKKEINVGDIFNKRYMCINCFSHVLGFVLDNKYTGHMDIKLKGATLLKGKDALIWTPYVYYNNDNEYINEINKEENKITERRVDGASMSCLKESNRYTFIRDRTGKNEFFKFVGLFNYDKNESDRRTRIWKKTKDNIVSLHI